LTEPSIGRIVAHDPDSWVLPERRVHFALRVILSENRFPLFGITRREAAMNVKAILAAKKQGGDTIGIEPTANLAAAAKLLATHHIGALVIRGAGGRLAGILSERDIVRALAEHGATALDLPVGQVMTRDVETCGEDDTVASIMERMTAGKFRHMPVLRNGKLAGLISIGDVVKQRVDEVERESEAMRDYIRTA
jgi:CBS domain-containing protein